MRWDKWLSGLFNSILGATGMAGAGYFASMAVGTSLDWRVLGTTIGIAAVWNFFSFLKDHKIRFDEDAVDPASLQGK